MRFGQLAGAALMASIPGLEAQRSFNASEPLQETSASNPLIFAVVSFVSSIISIGSGLNGLLNPAYPEETHPWTVIVETAM